jgi:SAM-dependent methyltransferase
MAEMLAGRKRVLDPFAGTGKIVEIERGMDRLGLGTGPDLKGLHYVLAELEPEWSVQAKDWSCYDPARVELHVGDSTKLHEWLAEGSVDAIATSPAYGNRMADKHSAKDIDPETGKLSKRMTYRHSLNRALSANNAGGMQWGSVYQRLHAIVWRECWRVLSPGGIFVLNVSDHIRGGEVQHVTAWHLQELQNIGFRPVLHQVDVTTPRMRFGANREKRCKAESVILLWKPTEMGAPVPEELARSVHRVDRLNRARELDTLAVKYMRLDALPEFSAYVARRERGRTAMAAMLRAGFDPKDFDSFEGYRESPATMKKMSRGRGANPPKGAPGAELLLAAAIEATEAREYERAKHDPHDAEAALVALVRPWLDKGLTLQDFAGRPTQEVAALQEEAQALREETET